MSARIRGSRKPVTTGGSPTAASDRPLLELDGALYAYPNGLLAIQDLSLKVEKSTRLAVVGPSGCGKSTLLRLITELAKPSAGSIRLNYAPSEPDRATLTKVFQADTLLPWLTVSKNVGIYYRLHPGLLPKAEVDARVDQLLAMVGLDGMGHLYPKQLSGGMRRRVAFLAAIAPRPQLLLLDEPFSSVDEPTRVEIHQEVASILDEFQIATVLVTHDLAEAVSLADEVAILSARPARVAEVKQVEVTRTPDLFALRATPEFLSAYSTLWDSLSHEIKAGKLASSAS